MTWMMTSIICAEFEAQEGYVADLIEDGREENALSISPLACAHMVSDG